MTRLAAYISPMIAAILLAGALHIAMQCIAGAVQCDAAMACPNQRGN